MGRPRPAPRPSTARREARPRGRGRPGFRVPQEGSGPRAAAERLLTKKKTLDHQGQPLPERPARSDTGSSRERAPRARRRRWLPHSARGCGGARPGPSRGPAPGTCGRQGHRGPRRPAPEPLCSLFASCQRHDPTGRAARARGPCGVSPGRAPPSSWVSRDPRSAVSWPPHATSPSPRVLGAPEGAPAAGPRGAGLRRSPWLRPRPDPHFCAGGGGPRNCRTPRLG